MIAATSNRSAEADARYRLATLASMAGMTTVANDEYVRAGRLYASLPQNEATQTYEMYGEFGSCQPRVPAR